MDWAYEITTWQFAVVVLAAMLVPALGGLLIVRRFASRELLRRHNEIAGFVASIVGVIYAVLLSFVVVVVWQEYDNSVQVAQKEASAVGDLYHLSSGMPPAEARELRRQLMRYVDDMLAKEWPAMQRGTESRSTEADGHRILRTIMLMKTQNAAQEQVRSSAMSVVQTLFDARRERRSENETSLPRILWMVLILGAAITIGFTYFFGMDSWRLQLAMTGLLTVVVAMMFVLIVELDFPFRGETKVQPGMWADIRAELGTYDL